MNLLCMGQKYCSCTVYESYSTIHTFKNYFVTVFSVSVKISCIQMNPKFQEFITKLTEEVILIHLFLTERDIFKGS